MQSHADTCAASGFAGGDLLRPSLDESAALHLHLAEEDGEVQPETHARTRWTEPRKKMEAGAAG